MKRGIKFLAIILCCFGIFATVQYLVDEGRTKRQIFHLVNQNIEVLLNDIREQNYENSLKLPKIESVQALEDGIDFYCGGYGIVPSSHEYGFYYTYDDTPKGIWCGTKYCESKLLEKDGDGYSTNKSQNYYYTQRICEHFYYYEVHF